MSFDSEAFKQLRFRHTWRPYQERVLEAVGRHLLDAKLHVVAAPGSGKTTLGLEIFRRLAKPALVLSPTRIIRDQWIDRLQDFLETHSPWPPRWTSADLNKPALLTSATYQALHTKYRDGDGDEEDGAEDAVTGSDDAPPSAQEIETLIAVLSAAGIGTLILDEAHHLRAEWWKALSLLAERLPGLSIVSLTATPPYDVIGTEWSRYEELCGPIDEEISVPELVKAGTLCPHQDFVWAVTPLRTERQLIKQYDEAVDRFGAALLGDPAFRQAVAQHPCLAAAELDEDAVLDAPEAVVALLVYLNKKGEAIPDRLAKLLDIEAEDLPSWGRRWCQVLLKAYLFDKSWKLDEPLQQHRKELASALRAEHLLERQNLSLEKSRLAKSRLTLSAAKIDACVQIHRVERRFRGDALRQVILLDFIRDKAAPGAAPDAPLPLGAWPVFKALVASRDDGIAQDVALLSGRMVVIHESLLAELCTVGALQLSGQPLQDLPGFICLRDVGSIAVRGMTALLNAGRIRTLVGTRALLGEGWDAPVVNSLVLASFVGSYMLTNQMRGRAIRVDKRDPHKIASIWHIVAVAPGLASGGLDIEELAARFRTFVGLSEREAAIENGLHRLATRLLDDHDQPTLFDGWQYNGYMIRRLRRIENVARRWQEAIQLGEAGHISPTVKAKEPPKIAPILFTRTLKYLLLQIVGWFGGIYAMTADMLVQGGRDKPLLMLGIALCVAAVITLPKFLKAAWLWMRHLPVDGTVRQIALAVRDSLCQTDQLLGAPASFPIATTKHDDGSFSISMSGGTFFERALFADSVNEILGAVENPRYLLTRGGGSRFARIDYHAVPIALGNKKEHAETLRAAWVRRVGPTELIYLRNPDGRRLLLKARSRAFSNRMQTKSERFDRWS